MPYQCHCTLFHWKQSIATTMPWALRSTNLTALIYARTFLFAEKKDNIIRGMARAFNWACPNLLGCQMRINNFDIYLSFAFWWLIDSQEKAVDHLVQFISDHPPHMKWGSTILKFVYLWHFFDGWSPGVNALVINA